MTKKKKLQTLDGEIERKIEREENDNRRLDV